MSKNGNDSRYKVMAAAQNEFLEYGFTDASMRRIAQAAGMTVSAIYKHFKSKEDLFAALLEPLLTEFDSIYAEREKQNFEFADNTDSSSSQDANSEDLLGDMDISVQIISFIYDHYDEFRLLICKSQGTKFEDFIHNFAIWEEDSINQYMRRIKRRGVPVKAYRKNELHLLVTAHIDAIFQTVRHGYMRKEALHYARTLDEFYRPAWHQFFGI